MNGINNPYLLQYFEIKPSTSVQITYKEASQEDREQVQQIYSKAGLKESIVSVQQPEKSAEINNQNFIITTKSGEKLSVRRCHRLTGLEKYGFLSQIFDSLKKEGVRTPEFYPLETKKIPYFEIDSTHEKVSWVFFKHVQGKNLFTGETVHLKEAAEQIGRMHACIKSLPHSTQDVQDQSPHLTLEKWEFYQKFLDPKQSNADEYDKLLGKSKTLIEEAVNYVEERKELLRDPNDLQMIHFDLNSANFIVDQENHVTIMDFDEIKPGNIYTDIAFAFHRLITTCMEQGNQDLESLIKTFFGSYQTGNPSFKLNVQKLAVAMVDRALRNIQNNLFLKYEKKSKEWLGSILVNIKRLQQINALCEVITPSDKELK